MNTDRRTGDVSASNNVKKALTHFTRARPLYQPTLLTILAPNDYEKIMIRTNSFQEMNQSRTFIPDPASDLSLLSSLVKLLIKTPELPFPNFSTIG